MGWLDDAMEKQGIKSQTELARRLLKRTDWPPAARLGERALGNQIGKLAKRREVGWWANPSRDGAKAALADELGIDISMVDDAVALDAGPRPSQGDFPLDMLRYARGIQMQERPFPGIPEEVRDHARWSHLWWRVPAGVERTFMGRWLEVRQIMHVVVRDWDDLLEQLPESGTAYVEVTHPSAIRRPRKPEQRGSRSHTEDPNADVKFSPLPLPPALRICIATSAASPGPFEYEVEWTTTAIAAPRFWLDPLLNWVAQRIEGEPFDVLGAKRLLSSLPLDLVASSPGEVLALCGVIDHVGAGKLNPERLDEWIAPYLAVRFGAGSAPPVGSTSEFLRTRGVQVLEGLVRSAMVDGSDLETAYSPDQWRAWLPVDLVPGPDLAAAQKLVPKGKKTLTTSEVTALHELLTPSPHQVIAALQAVRLLDQEHEGVALSPVWITAMLVRKVAKMLLGEGPKGWGALGLHDAWFGAVVEMLFDKFAKGDWREADAALTIPDRRDPASVVAVDAAFRAAGLAVLAGSPISKDLATGLCRAMIRVSVQTHGDNYPRPLIDHRAGEGAFGAYYAYFLAWFAVSEHAPRPLNGAHPAISPWGRQGEVAPAMHVLLSAALGLDAEKDSPQSAKWTPIRLGACRMAERLLDEGLVEIGNQASDLFGPRLIIDAVVDGEGLVGRGNAVTRAIDSLRFLPGLWDVLKATAEGRVPWPQVVEALWGVWALDQNRIQTPVDWQRNKAQGAAEVWSMAPISAIQTPCVWTAAAQARAYEHFSDAQWMAFLAATSPDSPYRLGVWKNVPDHVLRVLLTDAGGLPRLEVDDVLALWRRTPDLMKAAIAAGGDEEVVARVLYNAPVEVDLLDLYRTDQRGWLVWLHRVVAARGPQWRRAYALLVAHPSSANRHV